MQATLSTMVSWCAPDEKLVFLSHTRSCESGSTFASRLVHRLKRELSARSCTTNKVVSVFFDEYCVDPGSTWRKLILEKCQNCHVFVCVVSGAYVQSKWCMTELAAVLERPEEERFVLPIAWKSGNEMGVWDFRDEALLEQARTYWREEMGQAEDRVLQWSNCLKRLDEIQQISFNSTATDREIHLETKVVNEVLAKCGIRRTVCDSCTWKFMVVILVVFLVVLLVVTVSLFAIRLGLPFPSPSQSQEPLGPLPDIVATTTRSPTTAPSSKPILGTQRPTGRPSAKPFATSYSRGPSTPGRTTHPTPSYWHNEIPRNPTSAVGFKAAPRYESSHLIKPSGGILAHFFVFTGCLILMAFVFFKWIFSGICSRCGCKDIGDDLKFCLLIISIPMAIGSLLLLISNSNELILQSYNIIGNVVVQDVSYIKGSSNFGSQFYHAHANVSWMCNTTQCNATMSLCHFDVCKKSKCTAFALDLARNCTEEAIDDDGTIPAYVNCGSCDAVYELPSRSTIRRLRIAGIFFYGLGCLDTVGAIITSPAMHRRFLQL